jgi:hypothetical protein
LADNQQQERHRFRIFHRESVVAQPEPTEGRHRRAEQEFWARTLRKQRNLNLLTFLAAAAAIAAFVVLYKSLKETRETSRYAQQQAQAASTTAAAAQEQLLLSERPWIKIRHRIIKPLTFHVKAWKGEVASMAIEDTLENVGPTVAVDVLSWEDVIPVDIINGLPSFRTAVTRQNQWCDANRHPKGGMTGFVLFPKDPFVGQSTIGPTMDAVLKAAAESPFGLHNQVSFVMDGRMRQLSRSL